MTNVRWKLRFKNYEKSYKLLEEYSNGELSSEIEQAGIVYFYKVTFELAVKVLEDYLEVEGFTVITHGKQLNKPFRLE
ncbi:nucleotidyltransferase substrate binding protein [Radiobacillus kanasensis]|uniref:nucleotidyltransferase substrate binding protein n=1 Tax=Radiobacillus kanasensis TaxID=2844358 RepID=UPI0022AA2466|nr:nucleotidyltransferase substrate binding protein [Radiobacillus kanasensis]